MNKKQLEKEVLRLKSAGLTKEQIKNVLIKDVSIRRGVGGNLKPKPTILLSDIINDYYSGFTKNEKPSVSKKSRFGEYIIYNFISSDEKIKIFIKDYYITTISSSQYDINFYGNQFNYNINYKNDIFRFIETNNSSLTLFYALRGLCLGIFDEHKNTVIQDEYLLRKFIDNADSNRVERLKEDLGFYDSHNHYYDLNAEENMEDKI